MRAYRPIELKARVTVTITRVLNVAVSLAAIGFGSARGYATENETRKWALLIGIGYKTNPDLTSANVDKDIDGLADVLVSRGNYDESRVRVLRDPSRKDFAEKIAAFLTPKDSKQDRPKPGDQVLIYFTGHG